MKNLLGAQGRLGWLMLCLSEVLEERGLHSPMQPGYRVNPVRILSPFPSQGRADRQPGVSAESLIQHQPLRGTGRVLEATRPAGSQEDAAEEPGGSVCPHEAGPLPPVREGGSEGRWAQHCVSQTPPGVIRPGAARAPSLPEPLCVHPTASFKRPVVILGPIADIAMQKLSTELPALFEIARECPPHRGELCSAAGPSVLAAAGALY